MEWSAGLAYCVGIITTDGSLSKDGRHIYITSKDYDQILNVMNVLKLNNKIGQKGSSYKKDGIYYILQFGNVKLYKFLISIGLFPNKTKTISRLSIPKEYFSDFLRGHLDGDGFTYSYWDKRWKSSFMLYTGFVSASLAHLEWLRNEISNLYNASGRIKHSGKAAYQLVYAKRSSSILLNKIYYQREIVCLERKRFKIEAALGIMQRQAGMLKLVYRHA